MVSSKRYVPRCGDAIRINFSPQAGHEQAGRRPALVLSPENYNARIGLVILCPITSQSKGYPFEVDLPDGLPITGVILSDQIKSFDWRARGVQLICSVPEYVVSDVIQKLDSLLPE